MSQITTARWKRPDSVPYPSIWSRFNGSKETNGIIPKFFIQDITEEQYGDVISFMEKGFLRDETLCRFSGLLEDQVSIEDYRKMWKYILEDRLGLVCYMENPDPNGKPILAGANCTHIIRKTDPDFMELKGSKATRVVNALGYVSKKKDLYNELDVESYLNAMGLYVSPEFRGQGIGLELLKAREPLCRAVGIKATITAFTAISSQKLAGRIGFKDIVVISYVDLEKEKPEFCFPGIEKHTENLKYMYLIYN